MDTVSEELIKKHRKNMQELIVNQVNNSHKNTNICRSRCRVNNNINASPALTYFDQSPIWFDTFIMEKHEIF